MKFMKVTKPSHSTEYLCENLLVLLTPAITMHYQYMLKCYAPNIDD